MSAKLLRSAKVLVGKGMQALTHNGKFEPDPWQIATPANVSFQDELDEQRLSALEPYSTVSSSVPFPEIVDKVHFSVDYAYRPSFEHAPFRLDYLHRYRELISFLSRQPNLKCRSACNIAADFPNVDGIECNIRHDVDIDIIASVKQSEIEGEFGIETTHFILHTAKYYGQFARPSFLRNEESAALYKQIQDNGQEVALHTDSMTYYQYCGIDGAQSIVDELSWLRSQGLNIKGTVAHNNTSVYGCENYSIFKGRKVKPSMPAGPMGIFNHERWAPLQLLDEEELGLTYEANDLFHQREVPLFYAATRGLNRWFCRYDDTCFDERSSPRRRRQQMWHTQDEVIDMIARLVAPCYVILPVHPVYFGGRIGLDMPWSPQGPTDEVKDGLAVWAGFSDDGQIEAAAVNAQNEYGQFDLPAKYYREAGTRLLALGPFNAASRCVGADARFAQSLAWWLSFPPYKTPASAMSHRSAGLSQSGLAELVGKVREEQGREAALFIGLDTAEDSCREHIAFANSEAAAGRPVLIYVDGHGRGDVAPPPELLADLRAVSELDIVNPFEAFSSYDGVGRTLLESFPGWGEHGHCLLARMLLPQLVEKLGVTVEE